MMQDFLVLECLVSVAPQRNELHVGFCPFPCCLLRMGCLRGGVGGSGGLNIMMKLLKGFREVGGKE